MIHASLHASLSWTIASRTSSPLLLILVPIDLFVLSRVQASHARSLCKWFPASLQTRPCGTLTLSRSAGKTYLLTLRFLGLKVFFRDQHLLLSIYSLAGAVRRTCIAIWAGGSGYGIFP